MPEQSHPPYAPTAMFEPRQLNRWLDINPQNGPLKRTQTFITLPAFNQAYTWKGYSEIIASFNFEGPNNFSLTSLFGEIPINSNFYLTISWYDSLGNHQRYSLNSNVGKILFFTISPYTNQLIKKNFRLEVWSTGVPIIPPISTVHITTESGGEIITEGGSQIVPE